MKSLLAFLLFLGTGTLDAQPWQGFTSMALSPDGRFFATGGRDGEVLFWESATGEPVFHWSKAGSGPVVGLVFFGDGSRLAAAFLDGTVLSAGPGVNVQTVSPSSAEAKILAAAKGRWLAAGPLSSGLRIAQGTLWAKGSPDGQISVGNQSDGTVIVTWSAHQAAVTGLALAGDGSFLLSCSYNGELCRWDPQTGHLLGTLQSPHS